MGKHLKQNRYKQFLIFNICQRSFLPFYIYLLKCWHRLNEPNRQYTYVVVFLRSLEICRKASFSVLFRNFTLSNNVRISYVSCNFKKHKTTAKLSKKSRNMHRSNSCFIVSSLYRAVCYCFLSHSLHIIKLSCVMGHTYL